MLLPGARGRLGLPEAGRGRYRVFPCRVRGTMALPTPRSWASFLQGWETIHFCSKLPGWWCFVPTARGHSGKEPHTQR